MKVNLIVGMRLAHAVKSLLVCNTPTVAKLALESVYDDITSINEAPQVLEKYVPLFFKEDRQHSITPDVIDVREKIITFDIPENTINPENVTKALNDGSLTYNRLAETLTHITNAAKTLAVSNMEHSDIEAYYNDVHFMGKTFGTGYIPYGYHHLVLTVYTLPVMDEKAARVRYKLSTFATAPAINTKTIEAMPSFSNESEVLPVTSIDTKPVRDCINLLITRLDYYLSVQTSEQTSNEFTIINDVLYDLLNFTMTVLGVCDSTVMESHVVRDAYINTHVL